MFYIARERVFCTENLAKDDRKIGSTKSGKYV